MKFSRLETNFFFRKLSNLQDGFPCAQRIQIQEEEEGRTTTNEKSHLFLLLLLAFPSSHPPPCYSCNSPGCTYTLATVRRECRRAYKTGSPLFCFPPFLRLRFRTKKSHLLLSLSCLIKCRRLLHLDSTQYSIKGRGRIVNSCSFFCGENTHACMSATCHGG